MAAVIAAAWSRVIACRNWLFSNCFCTDRSSPTTWSTMRGFITRPSFAIPAETIAICSGVART